MVEISQKFHCRCSRWTFLWRPIYNESGVKYPTAVQGRREWRRKRNVANWKLESTTVRNRWPLEIRADRRRRRKERKRKKWVEHLATDQNCFLWLHQPSQLMIMMMMMTMNATLQLTPMTGRAQDDNRRTHGAQKKKNWKLLLIITLFLFVRWRTGCWWPVFLFITTRNETVKKDGQRRRHCGFLAHLRPPQLEWLAPFPLFHENESSTKLQRMRMMIESRPFSDRFTLPISNCN